MTTIAILAAAVTIGIPAAILLGYNGYKRDERKRQRRKAKDGRSGGRRLEDQLPASA